MPRLSENIDFLAAIRHATIGYAIRRKAWPGEASLYLRGDGALRWTDTDRECGLLDVPGGEGNLQAVDLTAHDWQAV